MEGARSGRVAVVERVGQVCVAEQGNEQKRKAAMDRHVGQIWRHTPGYRAI